MASCIRLIWKKCRRLFRARDGVAYPGYLCRYRQSYTSHVDALGVIAIGVGGLEAETVMLGPTFHDASAGYCRC